MKKLMTLIVLAMMFACEKESLVDDSKKDNNDCIEKINPNVVCTTQYDPVCGCNNKTYGNACMAGAAGIRVLYSGECKK